MESATTTPTISTPSPANFDLTSTDDSSDSTTLVAHHQLHPLNKTWSFWLMYQAQTKDKKDNWKNTQKKILDFSTVEDFWRIVNNVSAPSRLSYADYSVFRDGVSPMWEDPECAKGGRWIVAVDRFMRRDARSEGQEEALDESWLNVVLSLIGGAAYHDEIRGEDLPVCGGVCSVRKYNCKIALWVGTSEEGLLLKAGKQFRKSLKPLIDYMTNLDNNTSSEEENSRRPARPSVRSKSIQFEFFSNNIKSAAPLELPFVEEEE